MASTVSRIRERAVGRRDHSSDPQGAYCSNAHVPSIIAIWSWLSSLFPCSEAWSSTLDFTGGAGIGSFNYLYQGSNCVGTSLNASTGRYVPIPNRPLYNREAALNQ